MAEAGAKRVTSDEPQGTGYEAVIGITLLSQFFDLHDCVIFIDDRRIYMLVSSLHLRPRAEG